MDLLSILQKMIPHKEAINNYLPHIAARGNVLSLECLFSNLQEISLTQVGGSFEQAKSNKSNYQSKVFVCVSVVSVCMCI